MSDSFENDGYDSCPGYLAMKYLAEGTLGVYSTPIQIASNTPYKSDVGVSEVGMGFIF